MEIVDALNRIERSLADLGPQRVELLGRTSLLARTSQFRLRWAATRLHTFVVVSAFTDVPTRAALDQLLTAALEHSVQNKGGLPRGLQTGTAVVVVALVEHADPVALEWAGKVHGRRFAAIPFPVVAEAGTGEVHRPQRMIVGGLYASHLRRLVDTHVRAPLAG